MFWMIFDLGALTAKPLLGLNLAWFLYEFFYDNDKGKGNETDNVRVWLYIDTMSAISKTINHCLSFLREY